MQSFDQSLTSSQSRKSVFKMKNRSQTFNAFFSLAACTKR